MTKQEDVSLKTFPQSEPIHDLNQARHKLADMYDWKRHLEAKLRQRQPNRPYINCNKLCGQGKCPRQKEMLGK